MLVARFHEAECAMIDIFYTAIAAGLFIAACGYALACTRV